MTKATVISDSETHEKMLCMAPAFQPVAALVDYEYGMALVLKEWKNFSRDGGSDVDRIWDRDGYRNGDGDTGLGMVLLMVMAMVNYEDDSLLVLQIYSIVSSSSDR